jgi:hypothetical protein
MKFIEKIGVEGTQYDYITTRTAIAVLGTITKIKNCQKLTGNILQPIKIYLYPSRSLVVFPLDNRLQ